MRDNKRVFDNLCVSPGIKKDMYVCKYMYACMYKYIISEVR